MNNQQWQDILSLLSMMILADEKIYHEEVEAFKKAATVLKDKLCPEMMVTETMVFDWFVLHREDLNQRMSSLHYPESLFDLLDKLKSFPDKIPLLEALTDIAVSDGYKHGNESRLFTTAVQTWGVDTVLLDKKFSS